MSSGIRDDQGHVWTPYWSPDGAIKNELVKAWSKVSAEEQEWILDAAFLCWARVFKKLTYVELTREQIESTYTWSAKRALSAILTKEYCETHPSLAQFKDSSYAIWSTKRAIWDKDWYGIAFNVCMGMSLLHIDDCLGLSRSYEIVSDTENSITDWGLDVT